MLTSLITIDSEEGYVLLSFFCVSFRVQDNWKGTVWMWINFQDGHTMGPFENDYQYILGRNAILILTCHIWWPKLNDVNPCPWPWCIKSLALALALRVVLGLGLECLIWFCIQLTKIPCCTGVMVSAGSGNMYRHLVMALLCGPPP